MKKIKNIVLILFYSQVIYSQVDTAYHLSFLPLQVGNEWQFEVSDLYDDPNFEKFYTFIKIKKDTLKEGLRYYKTYFDFYKNHIYLRIDTNTLKVYQFPKNSPEFIFETYNLNPGNEYRNILFNAYYDSTKKRVGKLNEYTSFNSYFDVGPVSGTIILSNGFGFSYLDQFQWGGGIKRELIYAKINGIEYGSKVTSINENNDLPINFELHQNYPNPFNPSTTISFSIPNSSKEKLVKLNVYDSLGRLVSELVNEYKQSGNYKINFDGSNLSSGVSFYKLSFGEFSKTQKMILIK